MNMVLLNIILYISTLLFNIYIPNGPSCTHANFSTQRDWYKSNIMASYINTMKENILLVISLLGAVNCIISLEVYSDSILSK
jgi:hypothetical protein